MPPKGPSLHTEQKFRARLRLADRLAVVALALAAIAAIAGLVVGGLYRDTAEMVRQARAADLVTLVAVSVLAVGLWRASLGSVPGRLVAIAGVGYLAYNYAIYAFSVVINPLTPVHIAILGLATWSLILAIFGLDGVTLDRAARARLPRRATAVFLWVVAAMFAVLWLSQIVGAITSGNLPLSVSELNLPTNAVYTLDLAFALPLAVLSGVWLLRQDQRGPASALVVLAWLVLIGLSVLSIFGVGAAAGLRVDPAPVVIFGLITVVAAVLAVVGFKSISSESAAGPSAG